ncbi:MAG: hypothetical protein N5P05_004358 (plasmid) [Chroococcopsis gigantea SAG 12.99]|jgi:hypothetical protein|nr:hypothetical protein [Chroococcopsis gigantea SAG 12.99]
MYHDNSSGCDQTSAPKNQSNSKSVSNSVKLPRTPAEWQSALSKIPSDWVLTPVKDKSPLRPNWQHEAPIKRSELINLLVSGQKLSGKNNKQWHCRWTGVGVRLGTVSGGLMAIDADGHNGEAKLQELCGGELPETPCWTSGKEGRRQLIYKIPAEHHSKIKTVKLDCGDEQYLEFRWDGCQSVLPPSRHPETGQYRWLISPENTEVAIAPDWVIEQMLVTRNEKPSLSLTYTPTQNKWSDIDFARSYLEALSTSRADYYEDWIKVGMALKSVSDSLLPDWENWSRGSSKYKPGECDKKWRSFSPDKGVTLGTLAHMAKEDGWQFPFSKSGARSVILEGAGNDKKLTVTGDTRSSGDGQNPYPLSLADTVTSVTALLKSGLKDYYERNELDLLQMRSQVSKTAFWDMVKAIRCHLDEVQPADRQRLNQLIDWTDTRLDFQRILPAPLADALIHDGTILNVDPIALWQYLLPAVLSGVGKRVNLNIESHKVPAILWTCIVGESGSGKTRAENVVLHPLKERQYREYKRYRQEIEEYKEQLRVTTKDGSPPEKPRPEKKYLFEVTTIQALMRRLAEQGLNGSLWARDELAGLFKSLGQFSKGDNEAIECLLKTWDGHGALVERMDAENDSYNVFETRLSIAGGIQPGAFRQAFKDPEDAQGLQARFLYAVLKPQRAKRTRGYCELSDMLPGLYDWLSNCPEGVIELSREADQLYGQIYEKIGHEAEECPTPTVRAWLRKLPGQMLRIALALHLLEYYFSGGSSKEGFYTISEETLQKAFEVCRYYRGSFELVQEKTGGGDSMSSILLKIWDAAATRPEGVTPRDVYRSVKSIGRRAADLGRTAAAYTVELFSQLAAMGKGTVEQAGRMVRFRACLNPTSPQNPEVKAASEGVSQEMNFLPSLSELAISAALDEAIEAVVASPQNLSTQEIGKPVEDNSNVYTSSVDTPVTEVTVSLTHEEKGFGVSPDRSVSPVTEAIDSQEEISTPETAHTAMTPSIPSEYRETIAEVIAWLEICVGEGPQFIAEIMGTIKQLIAEAPEMKRWLWQSLTGEVKRVLPDLLGDDYQYLLADGA